MARPATEGGEKKARKPRSPSAPKAAYFVLQVLNEDGTQPMPFPKSRVRVLSVERSAERVLDIVEGGEHPHAFYLRGHIPVNTRPAKAAE